MSKLHDQILVEVETYCSESERFEEKGIKVSAARARAALGKLGKLSKLRRAEIQAKKNSM